MIAPTVGRVVWYWPTPEIAAAMRIVHSPTQPLRADICHVWGDRMVNLSINDSNGFPFARTSVMLRQEGDPLQVNLQGQIVNEYCEWMPYQVGQAKRQPEPVMPFPNIGYPTGVGDPQPVLIPQLQAAPRGTPYGIGDAPGVGHPPSTAP